MKFGSKQREAVVDQVGLDLAIDEQSLNKELMDQPLLYKKYSELDAQAQKAVRYAEMQLDVAKASAHLKLLNSETKYKVADMEALVKTDPSVLEAHEKLINLQESADKIRGALKACYQRHEALKDLSANRRKELID